MPEMEMVRIGDYCYVIKGKIGIKKAVAGKYPLVTTAEDRLSHNEYHFEKPSVIIPVVSSTGHGHASLRRIHYQEGKFAVGSILCAVTPKNKKVLNANYLYYYLDVYKEKLLVSRMKGMANVTLPVKEIENVEFPLLSIEKQMEWVALFEKTTSYTGSLTSEITHQQTILKKLHQSILQDAISGKLTEKWRKENPDVESATELLARIKAEKERMVKEKKIKKQKPLAPVGEDEIPFELPEGWAWCRLGDYFQFIDYRGRTPRKAKDGVRLITAKNIRMGYVDNNPVEFISDKLYKEWMTRGYPEIGDLLFVTEGATMGFVATINMEYVFALAQRTINLKPIVKKNCEGIKYFIMSPHFQKVLKDNATGSAATGVKAAILKNLLIPIPPNKEFKIVVDKLEKLFKYCDQLEHQINKSQQDSELLMQVVLQEAFGKN